VKRFLIILSVVLLLFGVIWFAIWYTQYRIPPLSAYSSKEEYCPEVHRTRQKCPTDHCIFDCVGPGPFDMLSGCAGGCVAKDCFHYSPEDCPEDECKVGNGAYGPLCEDKT